MIAMTNLSAKKPVKNWTHFQKLLISTNKKRHLIVGGIEKCNSECEKLLGIKIDYELMFNSHVKSLCKIANQKLNLLSRVAYQLDYNQRKFFLNALIAFQFFFAPAVWMFDSCKQNYHINRIHERALRIAYKHIILHLINFLKKLTSVGFMTETFRNW